MTPFGCFSTLFLFILFFFLGVQSSSTVMVDPVLQATPTNTPTTTVQPRPTQRLRATGQIAFTSNRSGTFEIYVMNADGSNVRRLTDSAANDGQYGLTWTRDGKQIVFSSDRGTKDTFQLFIMDGDGANVSLLAESACCYPSYSPDGKKIAYASRVNGEWEIFVADANGSNPVNLTNSKAADIQPAWSSNGRYIAFVSKRDHDWDEIYVMNADGTGQRRLTKNDTLDDSPSWSPDSQRIVYTSYTSKGHEIFAMNFDGSRLQQLTNNNVNDHNPAFSPDGRYIVLLQSPGIGNNPDFQIAVMNVDGSNLQHITSTPGVNGFIGLSWTRLPARVSPPTNTPQPTPTIPSIEIDF
jgi:TolB protein